MKKMLVIDGTALSYKAFASGTYSGAVTATGHKVPMLAHFMTYLLELMGRYEPSALVIAFGKQDVEPDIMKNPSYKIQFALLKVLIESLEIECAVTEGPVLDLIKAVVISGEEEEYKTYIATSEEKSFQLISKRTHVILFGKGRDVHYNPNKFYLEYGIEAAFYPDYFALTGHGTDNVPGIPGIGEKTAVRILQEYGRVEHIMSNINVITDHRLRDLFDLYQEEIILGVETERLQSLDTYVADYEAMAFSGFDTSAQDVMTHFGLSTLLDTSTEDSAGLPLLEYMD